MKTIFVLFTLFLLFSGCVKNNPDPAWLEINTFTLVNNPSGNVAGELTQNFTDAWVYVDSKLMGVFELPVKIPVLMEGVKKVQIFPTVRNNGISATKKIYPFTSAYEVEVDLVKNATITLNPVTQYFSNVKFTILDFEDANLGFEDSPSSLANITASNDPSVIQSFNGNSFGRVTLTEAMNTWISATNLDENLPRNGAEVYLEMDYYTTNDFVTGVLGINSDGVAENPNVQINAQDESTVQWKKIYIELKTIVSGSTSADYFEHSFEAILGEGKTSTQINIDNIKVVYF